ncbi:MAG TPA: ferrous iron transport protein B [Bacillota bacterium]|nr:ferrous iron transport protein B [Bacillota bacterium]
MSNGFIKVILVGNPNTGKTSLLNSLTGMRLHVGNWPGKTVEKKEGYFKYGDYDFNVVDLPGTYSIAPYSEEERVTYAYLRGELADSECASAACHGGGKRLRNRQQGCHGSAQCPSIALGQGTEVIVQTIDVNALERNLLMTMELLALGKRVVLAFNFNQEAKRRGITVDIQAIAEVLQVPVVPIEANRGENKEALLNTIIKTADMPVHTPDYLPRLLKDNGEIHHDDTLQFFKERIRPYYQTEKSQHHTERIDSFLLNRYTAFPVFILAMFLMFAATFTISTPIVDLIDACFGALGEGVARLPLPGLLKSLLTEGVIGGVGSVVSFAPLIFILFFMIAFFEDSGYLGRTVVLIDRLFQKFGISGQSFIPMILGFGCNVPAIMATRTIKSRKERLIGIMVNSFMSCGARLPVYALFSSIFFPKNAVLVIMLLYLAGIVVAFAASRVLSMFIPGGEQTSLIIELPPYRVPHFGNIVKHAWFHTKEFIKRAGTIILASVIIIWVLASLPLGVEYGSEQSFIGSIGKLIAPIFRPLGFGDWTYAIALIFGFVAKEVIIGTLATIHGGGEEILATILPNSISPLGALAFLFFVLLYVPCVATVAVVQKETGKWQYALAQIGLNLTVAWLVSWLVYHGGKLLGF